MTADIRALLANCPTVPTLERGTAGQDPKLRDSLGDNNGTDPLQSLARKVLARLRARDSYGTASRTPVPALPMAVGHDRYCPTPVVSNISCPLTQTDLDRWIQFEERAAISEYDGKLTRESAEELAPGGARGLGTGLLTKELPFWLPHLGSPCCGRSAEFRGTRCRAWA
jgi:hypothetical protein